MILVTEVLCSMIYIISYHVQYAPEYTAEKERDASILETQIPMMESDALHYRLNCLVKIKTILCCSTLLLVLLFSVCMCVFVPCRMKVCRSISETQLEYRIASTSTFFHSTKNETKHSSSDTGAQTARRQQQATSVATTIQHYATRRTRTHAASRRRPFRVFGCLRQSG